MHGPVIPTKSIRHFGANSNNDSDAYLRENYRQIEQFKWTVVLLIVCFGSDYRQKHRQKVLLLGLASCTWEGRTMKSQRLSQKCASIDNGLTIINGPSP